MGLSWLIVTKGTDTARPRAIDRRVNEAVEELEFGVVHGGLIRADRGFESGGGGEGLVVLLVGHVLLFHEFFIAVDFPARVFQLSLVPCQIGFHLLELRLKGAGINRKQKISFTHVLALFEMEDRKS